MGKKPLECVSNVFQLALEEFLLKSGLKYWTLPQRKFDILHALHD